MILYKILVSAIIDKINIHVYRYLYPVFCNILYYPNVGPLHNFCV